MVFAFFKTVSKCCCRRLVDDPFDVKTSDCSCIFCCLAFCIVEVSRNRDDRFRYFFTEVVFRLCFEFLKNDGRYFLWCVVFAFYFHFIVCTHVTFDRHDCVRVCDGLTFCDFPDLTLAVFESNDRWSRTVSFSVCDNDRLSAFHYCDT